MGFSHKASSDLHHWWVIQTSGRRFLESPISSCKKGRYSVHHGSSTAVSPGHSSPCETRSQWSYGCGMLWLHGEPSLTNAASLSVSEWGSSHSLLLGSGFTISRLGVSERGILEPHHFGSILLSHMFSWCWVVSKFVEWRGLVGAAGVCISGAGMWCLNLLTTARRPYPHESSVTYTGDVVVRRTSASPWVTTDPDRGSRR